MEKNKIIYLMIAFIFLIPLSLSAQKIDKLILNGKFENAEKYSAKQSGEFQKECYLKLAEGYYNIKEYQKAEQYYQKTDNPKNGYLKIADAYFTKGDYSNAENYYVKAGKSNDGYLKIANAYYDLKEYQKAEQYYQKTDNPKNGYLKIADVYFTKGDYSNAENYYVKAGKSNDGYLKIANAYYDSMAYQKAEQFYQKTDNPQNGYLKIADAYNTKGDYSNAENYYVKAGRSNDGNIKIANDALIKGNYNVAKKYFILAGENENAINQKIEDEEYKTALNGGYEDCDKYLKKFPKGKYFTKISKLRAEKYNDAKKNVASRYIIGSMKYNNKSRPLSLTFKSISGEDVIKINYKYQDYNSDIMSKITIIDLTNNEPICSIDCDVAGKFNYNKVICLDFEGNIIKKNGSPVLIEPFGKNQFKFENKYLNGYINETQIKLFAYDYVSLNIPVFNDYYFFIRPIF
jgi:tetratricopeptide (TPR) repeat protein